MHTRENSTDFRYDTTNFRYDSTIFRYDTTNSDNHGAAWRQLIAREDHIRRMATRVLTGEEVPPTPGIKKPRGT